MVVLVEGDLDELTLGLIDGEGGELVDDDDAAELGEADLADGLGFAGIEVDVLGGAGGAGAAILDEDFDRVRDGMQDGVDVRLDALGDLGFGASGDEGFAGTFGDEGAVALAAGASSSELSSST